MQYEEIAATDDRDVSQYFENMIHTMQSKEAAQTSMSATSLVPEHDAPVASSNDEENVSDRMSCCSIFKLKCFFYLCSSFADLRHLFRPIRAVLQ